MNVPNAIKQFTSNARYYLEAADKFPSPTKDAAQILLLIIAWENVVLADKKIHSWAMSESTDPKLLRSHEVKLDAISKDGYVLRVITGIPGSGTLVKEISFKTGAELKKLREICQYGADDETHELAKLFHRGWHSDNFRRSLQNKIEWTEMMIGIYEGLA